MTPWSWHHTCNTIAVPGGWLELLFGVITQHHFEHISRYILSLFLKALLEATQEATSTDVKCTHFMCEVQPSSHMFTETTPHMLGPHTAHLCASSYIQAYVEGLTVFPCGHHQNCSGVSSPKAKPLLGCQFTLISSFELFSVRQGSL